MSLIKQLISVIKSNDIKKISKVLERLDVSAVNDRNERGDIALHVACWWKNNKAVALLLTKPGIDINAKNGRGFTPLHCACRIGNHEAVAQLLAIPTIDVNVKDGGGLTPLHWACQASHQAVAMLLACPDIDVNVSDNKGETPIMVAARLCRQEILKLLQRDPRIDLNNSEDNRKICPDNVEGKNFKSTKWRRSYVIIKMMNEYGRDIIYLPVKKTFRLAKLKKCYAETFEIPIDSLRFLFDGERVQDKDTPEDLEIANGNFIEIFGAIDSEHILRPSTKKSGALIGHYQNRAEALYKDMTRVRELNSDEETEFIEHNDYEEQAYNYIREIVKYNYVFIEIETMVASDNQSKEITQIGAYKENARDNTHARFFKAIEPKKLNHYLDNYKLGGDLLQTLHMQKNKSGKYEFRKPFEIMEEGSMAIQCVSEEEALEELSSYLESVENCVIFSLCEASIEVLIQRMKVFEVSNEKIHMDSIKGFCSWPSFLKEVKVFKEQEQDFEEWYDGKMKNSSTSENVKKHADFVAKMVHDSIDRIRRFNGRGLNVGEHLVKASQPIKPLMSKQMPKEVQQSDSQIEYLEFFSSLRPDLPVTIPLKKLETYDVCSSEDEDGDTRNENVIDVEIDKDDVLEGSSNHIDGESENVNTFEYGPSGGYGNFIHVSNNTVHNLPTSGEHIPHYITGQIYHRKKLRRRRSRSSGRRSRSRRRKSRSRGCRSRSRGRRSRSRGRRSRSCGRESRSRGRESRSRGRESRSRGRESRSRRRKSRSRGHESRLCGRRSRSRGRSSRSRGCKYRSSGNKSMTRGRRSSSFDHRSRSSGRRSMSRGHRSKTHRRRSGSRDLRSRSPARRSRSRVRRSRSRVRRSRSRVRRSRSRGRRSRSRGRRSEFYHNSIHFKASGPQLEQIGTVFNPVGGLQNFVAGLLLNVVAEQQKKMHQLQPNMVGQNIVHNQQSYYGNQQNDMSNKYERQWNAGKYSRWNVQNSTRSRRYAQEASRL